MLTTNQSLTCCVAILLVSLAAPISRAAAPTDGDVKGWLADLSDRAPSRREAAYEHLRSLPRPALDQLRDAIKDHARDFVPEQDQLHDIVVQVFLATEPYPLEKVKAGDRVRIPGFMGVQFDPDQFTEESPYEGVEIRHIIPGLCASKYLQEGDVVLELTIDKEQRPLRSALEMMTVIGGMSAGEHVGVSLLRRGRMVSVEMILGGKPPDIEKDTANFMALRQTEAEAYWDDHFAELFDPRPAPTPPPPPPARASAR